MMYVIFLWTTPKNEKWTTALQAHCLLLVKYELWPELLKATQAVGTPIHLIAGRFSTKQKRLKWIKKSARHYPLLGTRRSFS